MKQFIKDLSFSKTLNHNYNTDVVKNDVYKMRVGKIRNIYLIDDSSFTYTFSCGANSEYSFSGCFYGCSKIKTLEDAKKAIIEFIPLWFDDSKFEERKQWRNNIK